MLHHDLLATCSDGDIANLTDILSKSMPDDNLPFTDMLENAASGGHSDVVQCLLNLNPSFTTIDDSVVRAAIYSGSADTFRLLYNKYPNILNVEHERRGTPLSIALVSRASLDFLSFLLSLGADPNISGGDTFPPLSWAAGLYDTRDSVELLLEHGARLNDSGALAAAAHGGKVDTVKYLLDHGADPNDGGTRPLPFFPLHSAVEKGHQDIVKLLVECGVDVVYRDVPEIPF
jgi:ankyrin repeat protein